MGTNPMNAKRSVHRLRTVAILSGVVLLMLAQGCGSDDDAVAEHIDETDHADHGSAISHDEDPDTAMPEGDPVLSVTLEAKSGSGLSGTADFFETDGSITLVLSVQGTPPGTHAVHLHDVGDCSAADGTSAGGHWNPTGADHGEWGGSSFHLGDIGNFEVGDDGEAVRIFSSSLWSIGSGQENDIVGRAIIIHAQHDDLTSQPTGAAGGRIGCGVVG